MRVPASLPPSPRWMRITLTSTFLSLSRPFSLTFEGRSKKRFSSSLLCVCVCTCALTNFLSQNVPEILNIYENEFVKLSDRYFVEFPWPPADRIRPLVEDGQSVLTSMLASTN